ERAEEPERREDSGLDHDLTLDDIPPTTESADTGDFFLEDEEEEPSPAKDTQETMVLSLEDADEEGAAEDAPVEETPPVVDAAPEALPKGDPVSCTACDAMGSCRRCGGRGKRFGRRCTECNGTGTCSACGGPGYIWVE